MPEPPHRYAVVYERPYSGPERPETLVRYPDEDEPGEAEMLTVEGTWRPTSLLDDCRLGLAHDEVVAVMRPQAQAFVDAWRVAGRLTAVPPGLDDHPTGATVEATDAPAEDR
jgi:hypothetical protein